MTGIRFSFLNYSVRTVPSVNFSGLTPGRVTFSNPQSEGTRGSPPISIALTNFTRRSEDDGRFTIRAAERTNQPVDSI